VGINTPTIYTTFTSGTITVCKTKLTITMMKRTYSFAIARISFAAN
jgi:hypothetical protein